MKKLIAIALVLVMCLSVLPMAALAAEEYYVAGVGALCGSEWDCGDFANMMNANGDGTYSMIYPAVAPGTYEFKVTNGTWDSCWPGENYRFEITAACDVTITFNPADGSVNATGANLQIPAPSSSFDSITIAGTGSLCGSEWNTSDAANQMTANGAVYTITYHNVPAGEHKFKFAANGSWNDNWGLPGGTALEQGVAMDAVYNSQDILLNLSAASNVTITFDLSAYDGGSKSGAKFTVTVGAATDAPVATQPSGGEESTGNIKVYAHVPESWTAPKVWVWERVGSTDTPAFAAWPGEAMTKADNGWWVIEVPSNINYVIINDGGSAQTADLEKNDPGDCWVAVTIVDGMIDGKVYASEPSLEDITPPTTQAPATQAPVTEPAADNGGIDAWVWIVIGVAVVAVVVVVVIVAKKKK
jgi:hypothetical protein